MIKTAVDLKSRLGNLDLNIRFNDFVFGDGCLLANVQVTNKTDRPINLEAIELHINDQIFKQVPIEAIDSDSDLLAINGPRELYHIEGGQTFSYFHLFPFCPYLKFNEMAHGLILIPFEEEIKSIRSLLLRIPVAGYDDLFEHSLNTSP